MFERNRLIIILIIATVALASSICAQENCYGSLTLNYEDYIDRDGTTFVELPLYMSNNCPLGGLLFDIKTDPFSALEPVDIILDTSRVSYWERIDVTRNRLKRRLRFLGIADLPNEVDTAPLDTGNGYLGTVLFRFGCQYNENITVEVYFDSVFFSDSTGYNVFDNVSLGNSTVYIGEEVTPVQRGDMNCDGYLRGSDVTFLVQYFRGINLDCPCSLCGGDSNNDGRIIGSDVTFLVNYFIGNVTTLAPCD